MKMNIALVIFGVTFPIFVSSSPESYDFILKALTLSFQEKDLDYLENIQTVESSEYIPRVKTSLGKINGVNLKESHGFFRIPFAKAPIENMRFEQSQAIERFPEEEINATIFGRYSCIQTGCGNSSCPEEMTEDCLFLNVHVPKYVDLSDSSALPEDRLPVIFWIHGGSLQTGSGTSPRFDGRYLSNITNTIVVSTNYRVGSFGFLAFKEENRITCNQGLGDQQLALQWVQDHIEVFGGDKNRVTIAGNSAGAQSVMVHLMSQKSAPFFHRAIIQSNPTLITYPDVDRALQTTSELLENMNCTSSGIQCLKEADPYEIVRQGVRIQAQNLAKPDLFGMIEPFRFVIDGDELKENPIEFVQNGGLTGDKQVVIGTTTDEMIYVPAYIPDRLQISQELFQRFLKYMLGEELGQAVATKYDEMADGPRKDYAFILGEIATDGLFICPSRALARLASKSSNVFLYSFAHAMDDPSCKEAYSPNEICEYAYHTVENPLVFRTDPLITYNFSDNDVLSANQLSYYWGNFAASGDPSSGDVTTVGQFPEWPKYTSMENLKRIVFPMLKNPRVTRDGESWINKVIDSPEGSLDTNYKEDICNFWDDTKYYVDLGRDPPSSATTTIAEDLEETTIAGDLEETTIAGDLEETTIAGDLEETTIAGDLEETTIIGDIEETTSGTAINTLCRGLLLVVLCMKIVALV